MTNGLRVFAFQGNKVRTVVKDGEPWFVLKDVCDALDIANNRDTASRLDDDEKGVGSTDTLGGMQDTTVINESGLYAVILLSRKPEAKTFKRWVTHDVLPSIRKHGLYAADELLANPDLFIKVLTNLKEMSEHLAKANAELDRLKDWYSIKRWANEHETDWRYVGDPSGKGQGWRKLVAASHERGLEIHKSFDVNYGQINIYHKSVFESVA